MLLFVWLRVCVVFGHTRVACAHRKELGLVSVSAVLCVRRIFAFTYWDRRVWMRCCRHMYERLLVASQEIASSVSSISRRTSPRRCMMCDGRSAGCTHIVAIPSTRTGDAHRCAPRRYTPAHVSAHKGNENCAVIWVYQHRRSAQVNNFGSRC